MNRLILCLKRNDQYNPFNKNMGCKNFMPVAWWDELVSGEFNMTPRLQTEAFAHFIIDRERIDWLREIVQPEEIGVGNFLRSRKYYFRPEDLAIDFNNPDLISQWEGPGHMELLDARGIPIHERGFRSIEKDWSVLAPDIDVKLVTSGTFTVGSGAEDYASFSAADADTGTQTGPLTFNLNTDVTDSTLANWTHDAASNKLTIGATSEHGGDVTAGFVYSVNQANTGMALSPSNSVTNEVSGFSFKRTVAGSSAERGCYMHNSNAAPIEIHDLFIDGNSVAGSCLSAPQPNTGVVLDIYNIVGYNSTDAGFHYRSIGGSPTGNLRVENSGFRGCGQGIDNVSRGNGFYQSIWGFTNTTDWANTTNGTYDSCSATDTTATGTNPHDSLVEANEVISTSPASSDFAHLKAGGTNELGGIAPITAVNDMAGIAYAGYPVGPFMPPVVAGGILEREYPRGVDRGILRGVA